MKHSLILIALLLLAACRVPVRAPPSVPAATTEELAARVADAADRSDHEAQAKVREQLAGDALRAAEACMQKAPQSAACLYSQAVALGLEARAHPARALELLKSMLDSLAGAETIDASYDHAGPERVRALVLIRAPGWPLGPGDAEAGLAAARRAVILQPDYPPNLLALAEALGKNGAAAAATDNYLSARKLAQALPAGSARDQWMRQADEGLRQK